MRVLALLLVAFVAVTLSGCGGNPTPPPATPAPTHAPTAVPTPVPTPVPPVVLPCTMDEWENILKEEKTMEYVDCLVKKGCVVGTTANTTCYAECLELKNISPKCATCVAERCIDGKPECPTCYSGHPPTPVPTAAPPTPAPTPYNCSNTEWKTVTELDGNQEYRQCDEQLGCWNGFGNLDKDCVITCLQVIGLDSACAHCVAEHCFNGACHLCNSGATPAPTATACSAAEESVAITLDKNEKYQQCLLQLGCWNATTHKLDEHCAGTCLKTVGCSGVCATCLVTHDCLDGKPCDACFPALTPSPTPSATWDCTTTEWNIVDRLAANDEYLQCDESKHCWNGVSHEYNKSCVSLCMQTVNISAECADCVVTYCETMNCPKCYTITPTPGPTKPLIVCTPAEIKVVDDLNENNKYNSCLIKNLCWKDWGQNINKTCESKCLQSDGVGLGDTCADCIAWTCTDFEDCTKCVGIRPTPAPTLPGPSPPPTSPPCNKSDETILNHLGNDTVYLECVASANCTNFHGRIDPMCMRVCLIRAKCSSTCAICIADHSPHGDWNACYADPTPQPPAPEPCTMTEWDIVTSLDTNKKYLDCDKDLQCWSASGVLNKECVAVCMQGVGCSSACAKCVVDDCFEGNCDACHGTPTPAPTNDGNICTQAEWELIKSLDKDVKYLTCIDQLGCWEGFGKLNTECWKTCLQIGGCSSYCANCVADCSQTGNCDACHGPEVPTPSPTNVVTVCTSDDWKLVTNLVRNEAYISCEERAGCWKGYGVFDQMCVAGCMVNVKISLKCADCVVKNCAGTNCPICYAAKE